MTKYIAALAAAGALLMVGCGVDETARESQPLVVPEPDPVAAEPAEPDPVAAEPAEPDPAAAVSPEFELGADTEWTIWAKINTADPHGIAIDKVEDGDELTIETLSGVGYFSGKSGWWQVLSAIYKISGAAVPTGSTAASVITALRDETPAARRR